MRHGNIRLPKLVFAPELLSYVCFEGFRAYAATLATHGNEHGTRAHVHKLMQSVAHCCPLRANDEVVLGAVEAPIHIADRVRLATTPVPSSSPKGSKPGQRSPITKGTRGWSKRSSITSSTRSSNRRGGGTNSSSLTCNTRRSRKHLP